VTKCLKEIKVLFEKEDEGMVEKEIEQMFEKRG